MEPKQNKRVFLFLLLFLLVVGVAGTIAEQITLSAYYPSPMGDYQTVRLVPTAAASMPTCSATVEGSLYYDQDQNRILFCNGTAWTSMGVWTQTGSDIYPNDLTADVGIGTSSPGYDLDVTGVIQIGGSYPYLRIADSNSSVADDTYSLISNNGQLTLQVSDGVASNFNTAVLDRNVQYFPGRVGIGVTSPAEELQVSGDIQASGNVRGTSLTVGGTQRFSWPNSTAIWGRTGDVPVGWNWTNMVNVGANRKCITHIVCWRSEFQSSGPCHNNFYNSRGVYYNETSGYIMGFYNGDQEGPTDGYLQIEYLCVPP